MGRAAWAVLLSCLWAGSVALAQESAAPAAPPGRVDVLVFGPGSAPLAGVLIETGDGASVATSADGAVHLSLPPGEVTLSLRVGEGAAQPLAGVRVASGESTLVIATVDEAGVVAELDVQLPASVQEGAQQAAAVEVPSGPPGIVTGEVVSLEGGEPIEGAKVYVRGQAAEAITDAQGRFTLELPAGQHRLSFIHTAYSTQTADVEVVAEQSVPLRAEMSPAAAELEAFVVTAPFIQGGVASTIEERRNSAAVTDAVGAEDIARMPASSAAQAAQRVVGATIVGGRFVYVRGLGERYTNALLNGAPLPSPEPDRATVPLDLFPAQIIESLDISKTFTPDVPGDFAGGSVRIVTRKVPEKRIVAVSLSSSVNSESTFVRTYGQPAGPTDVLGFDGGHRALSSEIPTEYPLIANIEKPDGTRVTRDEIAATGPQLNTRMHPERVTNLPNLSGNAVYGDTFELGDTERLGVLGSLIYSRTQRRVRGRDFEYAFNNGELEYLVAYPDVETQVDSVRWGAFANSQLQLGEHHTFTLTGMRSQLADTTTSVRTNGLDAEDRQISTVRLSYVSRGLTLGMLQGHHEFEALEDAELDWTLSLSTADRNEPDTRDTVVFRDTGASADDPWTYLGSADNGRHFYSEQDELAKVVKLDWTQPLIGDAEEADAFALTAKGGTMLTLKDREFGARRFVFQRARGADFRLLQCPEPFDPIACPRALFDSSNIGPALSVVEGAADAYDAGLDVYAGYLMGDVIFSEQWRAIAGARVEATDQVISAKNFFSGEVDEMKSNTIDQVDVLPSASVVYSPVQDLNVRLAATRTIGRPQLREIAEVPYTDYFGGALNTGNRDLRLTSILNGDLRVEYFPSPREVIAASVFAKDFGDPIEPVLVPSGTTPVVTYANAKGATMFGAEIEVRKSLDFVSESLEDFTLMASLMLADSSIQLEQTDMSASGVGALTNLERPLVQAAPYVFNAALDYENEGRTQVRLLYNVIGPRIVAIGSEGLDDDYLHPQHLVDLNFSQGFGEHWRLRVILQNILDAEYVVTQGRDKRPSRVRQSYKDGVTATVGVAYSM